MSMKRLMSVYDSFLQCGVICSTQTQDATAKLLINLFCCDDFTVHPPGLLAVAEDLETLCEPRVIMSMMSFVPHSEHLTHSTKNISGDLTLPADFLWSLYPRLHKCHV